MDKSHQILQVMRRLKDIVKQNMEAKFGELNLTGPQGMVVGTLARFGEMKVSDLSTKVGLSNSTVSGILDRLENQGFVERIRSIDDRRVVNIKLSSSFNEKTKEHFKCFDESLTGLLEKATEEEIEKILVGFATLDILISRNNSIQEKE